MNGLDLEVSAEKGSSLLLALNTPWTRKASLGLSMWPCHRGNKRILGKRTVHKEAEWITRWADE